MLKHDDDDCHLCSRFVECSNFETSELEDVLRWSRVTVSFCSSWNNNCDIGLILIRFNMRAAINRIDIMIMEDLNRIFNMCILIS